jgi:hypothetical protein
LVPFVFLLLLVLRVPPVLLPLAIPAVKLLHQ